MDRAGSKLPYVSTVHTGWKTHNGKSQRPAKVRAQVNPQRKINQGLTCTSNSSRRPTNIKILCVGARRIPTGEYSIPDYRKLELCSSMHQFCLLSLRCPTPRISADLVPSLSLSSPPTTQGKPTPWVSPAHLARSALLPVPSVPTTVRPPVRSEIIPKARFGGLKMTLPLRSDLCQQGRRELSRLVASPPTPVSVPSVSTSCVPAAVTTSTVLSVSTLATSPGPPRAAPARPV